jgi:hypothetical protein
MNHGILMMFPFKCPFIGDIPLPFNKTIITWGSLRGGRHQPLYDEYLAKGDVSGQQMKIRSSSIWYKPKQISFEENL